MAFSLEVLPAVVSNDGSSYVDYTYEIIFKTNLTKLSIQRTYLDFCVLDLNLAKFLQQSSQLSQGNAIKSCPLLGSSLIKKYKLLIPKYSADTPAMISSPTPSASTTSSSSFLKSLTNSISSSDSDDLFLFTDERSSYHIPSYLAILANSNTSSSTADSLTQQQQSESSCESQLSQQQQQSPPEEDLINKNLELLPWLQSLFAIPLTVKYLLEFLPFLKFFLPEEICYRKNSNEPLEMELTEYDFIIPKKNQKTKQILSKFSLPIEVQIGQIIVWRFRSQKTDVAFSIDLCGEPILLSKRYASCREEITGVMQIPSLINGNPWAGNGVCEIKFENKYAGMLTATSLSYYCRVIEGIEYSDCRRRAHEKNIGIRQKILSLGQIREAFAKHLEDIRKIPDDTKKKQDSMSLPDSSLATHAAQSSPPASTTSSAASETEIMKLKLEIEALRSQNNHLQQKLLISLSDQHSSLPMMPEPHPNETSTSLPLPSPSQVSYPPEGFLEEGMAALMNSTPTKLLRGMSNIVSQSLTLTGVGVGVASSSSFDLLHEQEQQQPQSRQQQQQDLDDFEAWYLEQFGETVRASKEGNSVAFTKGLKSFARRVSSIFKSDEDHSRFGMEASLTAGTLSDEEEEDGNDTASGSEISQQHPEDHDELDALPSPSEREKQEQEQEEKEANSRAPINTLSIPTLESSPLSSASAAGAASAVSGSLLSSLRDDEELNLASAAPQSISEKPTQQLTQQQRQAEEELELQRQRERQRQQEDDEFAAVTLQRMRSLRQRILDSIQHPPPPPLPNTPTDVTVDIELEKSKAMATEAAPAMTDAAAEATKAAGEPGQETVKETKEEEVLPEPSLLSSSPSPSSPSPSLNSEITSLPTKSSPLPVTPAPVAVAAAAAAIPVAPLPPVVDLAAAEDDDEPRERSCTVDSDDEEIDA